MLVSAATAPPVPTELKETSALPTVGTPASPVVKLAVNFWIFIRRSNLVNGVTV